MKSLVVYYTRGGNTRFVAETIAAEIGADIEEVVDLKKRSGILGYLNGGRDARQGKETEISPNVKSPDGYELILVGSPIWAGRPAPAITTYLKKNDLSGKKVGVFFSQGGKKPNGFEQAKALMPNSEFVGELSVTQPLSNKEKSEKQIVEWCKELISKS
ncbi:MAG: flavodoxin family protein [Ignavibacteria bacterium]